MKQIQVKLQTASGSVVLMTALWVLATMCAGTAAATPFEGTVRIVNGTTGQPGAVDLISLLNRNTAQLEIASLEYQVGEAVFTDLEVNDATPILVHGINDGIDYYAEIDGQALRAGRATLHVFDSTTSLEDVEVAGMNVVLRQSGDQLQVEYIWRITNRNRPQKTVKPDPTTFEALLPADAVRERFTVQSAPNPDRIESQSGGLRESQGVAVVLKPGNTSIGLTFSMPYGDNAIVPVGTNLPILAWSVLTTPSTLWVSGRQLSSDNEGTVADFQRKVGPSIAAAERYEIRVTGGTEARAKAADSAAAAQPVLPDLPEHESEDGGFPWIAVIPIFVAIVVVMAGRRYFLGR